MTDKNDRQRFEAFLSDRKNWGRWGSEDQAGAINLINQEKLKEAAALVRDGISVSLSRSLPTSPAANNPFPAAQYLLREQFTDGGGAVEYLGIRYHGHAATHVDALCHMWSDDGMWNGRDPDAAIDSFGARWGGVQHWRHGIVTRGVLIDVPASRNAPYVEVGEPVRGEELVKICDAQGVEVTPGDALLVYSGRDRFDAANPAWGSTGPDGPMPGLHWSCLELIRNRDVSALVWDMLEQAPYDFGNRPPLHSAISAFGLAIIDNCDMAELVSLCRASGRFDFMLVVAPLVVEGGTGSPANPLAIL